MSHRMYVVVYAWPAAEHAVAVAGCGSGAELVAEGELVRHQALILLGYFRLCGSYPQINSH